jgi:hypothetical protein
MISSLDRTRAMGRIAEGFMVDDYLPSMKIACPSPPSFRIEKWEGVKKNRTVGQAEISPKF